MEDRQYLIGMTTEIVAAYVGSNDIEAVDVPRLIRDVYSALDGAAHGAGAADAGSPKPAISVKKSINPDYIICLEDGLKFKSLKRHLSTKYEMSPEEYRQKWGLAPDYPMVAPNYAKARSALAKKMGLGRGRHRAEKAGFSSAD